MGCTWSSPPSQRRRLTPRRAMTVRHRLLAVADRAVMLFANRHRPVELEMSDHARALLALRGLHKVAAGGSNREASLSVPQGTPTVLYRTPAALTFGWERVPLPDAGADALPADVRALSERDASSATRATPTSGARADSRSAV